MNDSVKKAINAIFRTVIFVCFIICIVMIKQFIDMYGDAITEDTDLKIDKQFILTMGSYASLFKGLFFASIAAIVLSIAAGRFKASAGAVFFRTVLIASLVFFANGALDVCNALVDFSRVVDSVEIEDIEDLKEIDKDILEDAGIDDDRAEDMSEAFRNEKAVIPFILVPFAGGLVYLILSVTSLVNLLGKGKQGAACGGCDDARRMEGFDPSMFNGGNHFAQQNGFYPGQNPYPQQNRYAQPQQFGQPGQFGQPNQYGQPQYGQPNQAMNMGQGFQTGTTNPYIQNIINAANAAHPSHDHHDSAELHDLEADGEFHNYAQAEADMTDDRSDYLSQLQSEENRGHRVTDEDFM